MNKNKNTYENMRQELHNIFKKYSGQYAIKRVKKLDNIVDCHFIKKGFYKVIWSDQKLVWIVIDVQLKNSCVYID